MQDPRKVGATVILTADESTYSGTYDERPRCKEWLSMDTPQTLESGNTTTGIHTQLVSPPLVEYSLEVLSRGPQPGSKSAEPA